LPCCFAIGSRMFIRLLFFLTLIPFLEIYFLIRLSHSIGWGNTLIIIFLTGLIGAALLRKQGHEILMQIQVSAGQNQLPSDALAKGLFTFIGGLLLLTPGIITDFIGLSLIFPLTQALWKKYFMLQWQNGIKAGKVKVYTPFDPSSVYKPQNSRSAFDNEVIDIKASQSQTFDKKYEE
jgi:UPF0716 protein FxsA